MVLVTGDLHGDMTRILSDSDGPKIPDNSYLIVCGDCGLLWLERISEYSIREIERENFTLLFVDGNHENFDMLNRYPITQWNGGKVHKIGKNIIHLMRGQVFNIEDKKIFTFGGAKSIDTTGGILERSDPEFYTKVKIAFGKRLPFRVNHESWWKEEIPNNEELEEALKNIENTGGEVDYVITHALPTSELNHLRAVQRLSKIEDITTEYLETIKSKLKYKKWFCGHYHTDYVLNDKHIVMYESIRELY